MIIEIHRFEFGTNYTIGRMSLDGVYQCYTLEDKVRDDGIKIPGATAIPAGTYQVTIDMSARFGREMPHVLDVPNFQGIRIHMGNTDVDTEGCILLGQTWNGGDFIGNSRGAFDVFFPKLQQALLNGCLLYTSDAADE